MDDKQNEMKIINKEDIIRLVAKSLGKGYTIPMVRTIYREIEKTIRNLLIENNNARINVVNGIHLLSYIKPEHINYYMPNGKRIIQPPRKWVRAKVTQWFNRNVINDLDK